MNAMTPANRNSKVGTQFDPYSAGNSGFHPPSHSKVATQQTVTILQYSAVKKAANPRLEYSVWKPATSSFSASGRSNGTRFVSANEAIRNTKKLTICGSRFHAQNASPCAFTI